MEAIKHGEPRFDALRPSVFDPADFEVVDYLDSNDAGERGFAKFFKEALAEYGLTERWSVYDGPGDIQVCDHCGHRGLRYLGIVRQKSTGQNFVFGSACVARADVEDRATLKLVQLKKLAANRAQRFKLAVDAAYYLNENPDIREFLFSIKRGPHGEPQDSFSFVNDVDRKLNQYGYLFDSQAEGLRKVIAKRPEYEKRQAEREEKDANRGPAPEGRVEVQGEVLSVKWQDNDWGGSLKWLVELENGSRVWGSVPSVLWDSGKAPVARGDKVRFKATFTRSDDDETFAFAKRPTGGEVTEEAPAD